MDRQANKKEKITTMDTTQYIWRQIFLTSAEPNILRNFDFMFDKGKVFLIIVWFGLPGPP